MDSKFLKISCILLFAAAIAVNGNNTRSSSGSTRSNAEKVQLNAEKKITDLLLLNQKEPGNALVNNRLGYLYYSLGKYKNSEYHYKQALICNSKNVEARLGLYLVNMAGKEYAKAEAYCNQVISIDNLNYFGNLYLVYARMAQGKYRKAEIVCRKMLSAYPCNLTFLYLLKSNYNYQNLTKNAEQVQKEIDLLK